MKKGASNRWWVWSVAREDAVSYLLLPSRSTEAARAVLGDYAGGALRDGQKACLWPGLVRCFGDPKIPLDSKGVERALRGVAVGRKNHHGSRSKRETRFAALFYWLIESGKLCGVEPRAYLRQATLQAVRSPGTATLAREFKARRP